MTDVFLGLGSNLGDKTENIMKAIGLLGENPDIKIMAVSSLYETKPLHNPDQPDYINCVIKLDTRQDPHRLLKTIKSLEAALGRQPGTHMLPRPIDIDILLYGNDDIRSKDLTIPHSRLKERRFVLEPLLEIEPGAIDPVTSTLLSEYYERTKAQKLIKMKDSTEVWHAR